MKPAVAVSESATAPRMPPRLNSGDDFDGVGDLPEGLGGVETYPALLKELMRRGWSDAEIAKLAGGNVLRVMERAEDVRRLTAPLRALARAATERRPRRNTRNEDDGNPLGGDPAAAI